MRTVVTRALCLTAPGVALALLGLTGATAPAGAARVAVTARLPVTVYVGSSLDGTVTPTRVATNRPGRAINTHGANFMAATPDGRTVYVCCRRGGTVTPINTATNKPAKAINVGTNPVAIAITP